jgi:hypothetical protein
MYVDRIYGKGNMMICALLALLITTATPQPNFLTYPQYNLAGSDGTFAYQALRGRVELDSKNNIGFLINEDEEGQNYVASFNILLGLDFPVYITLYSFHEKLNVFWHFVLTKSFAANKLAIMSINCS